MYFPTSGEAHGHHRLTELEFFFASPGCGGLIGYERNNRLKEAGIRTHLIVALAAALIMVVFHTAFPT
ncbi:MAG: MgtC/SapB family protein [Bilophila wadsworthia]